jgi:diadenylate cyclase
LILSVEPEMTDHLKMIWPYVVNGWRPALEILILAVLIYYAFRFLRGTRGWPVVIGLVVTLVVLFAVSALLKVLKLQVLSWLLSGASTVFAFAILVLFQPELRRMLAELGNLPLFASAHEQRENIEVIIQACERLADVKIGALIAIEQSIQLRDAVESGIKVDCEATPEMLETIFFPNNAIHDGGVIIQGDRIAWAACIFPLTQRQDLNKSLGTRHRAAIGLSEETDAVVVVSEETGLISYAYKGQLVRAVTLEELRAFLSSVLLRPARPRRGVEWLRQRFGERFGTAPAGVTKPRPRPAAKPSEH